MKNVENAAQSVAQAATSKLAATMASLLEVRPSKKGKTTELGMGFSRPRTNSWVLEQASIADCICDCHLYVSDDEDWRNLKPAMEDAEMRDCAICGKCCPRCGPDCNYPALSEGEIRLNVDHPRPCVDRAHSARKAEKTKRIRSRHSTRPEDKGSVRGIGRSINPEISSVPPHPATHGTDSQSTKRKASTKLREDCKRQKIAGEEESRSIQPQLHTEEDSWKVNHQNIPKDSPRTAAKPDNKAAKPSRVSTQPRTIEQQIKDLCSKTSTRYRGNTPKPIRKSTSHPKPGTGAKPMIERERMPTSYDSRSIAADILRVAGIHPALLPLNAPLKNISISEFEESMETKGGKKI